MAILLLSADGRHLRFVAPRRFAELGSIPVTKRDSIAVGVLARRSGEVINNVPMVKHVSFFESIKLRDKPAPIQKMVTAPLVVRGQPIGVAQISRKGETAREAGPDFTPGGPASTRRRCSRRWRRTSPRRGRPTTDRRRGSVGEPDEPAVVDQERPPDRPMGQRVHAVAVGPRASTRKP